MAYRVPDFNLFADGWEHPNVPSGSDPDVTEIPCQLYVESRQGGADVDVSVEDSSVPYIIVRLPLSFSLEGVIWIWRLQYEDVDSYYKVRMKEFVHLGFPNAYIMHLVAQCNADGDPIHKGAPWANQP